MAMAIKRIFDLVLVFMALPVILPVYLACMATLLVFQGRPLHFCQERVGKNGAIFKLYKFRSMITNAARSGGFSTEKNDARVTKIGRVFRRLSLDELPQLVNVVIGNMSLVGPRPYLLAQKSQFSTVDWDKRLEVSPGLTGLAQVSGRSNCPPEERLRLDLEYVKTRSLWFDIRILFGTVKLVLFQRGTN